MRKGGWDDKVLPLGQAVWVIGGLSVLSWAILILLVVGLVWSLY